jgi:subtilisin family serine protease
MNRTRLLDLACLSRLVFLVAALSPALGLCQTKSDNPRPPKNESTENLIAKQQALFERINLAEAWKITKGDAKLLIGVIDNGFDFYHPDLKGQLIPGLYYSGGYHSEFYENVAHGTLVSSIMVARDGNPNGMVGLAPHCRVLTVSQGMIEHTLLKMQNKFFKENPKATMADLQKEMMKQPEALKQFGENWIRYQIEGAADGIRYLVDHGVKVINISGALQQKFSPNAALWKKLEDAFAYAAEKGIVIVLAAGNNAAQWDEYPGSAENVIVVGASLLNDARWEQEMEYLGTKIKQGSNFGKRLTVMAPVENLVVCVPHEERFYSCDDGPMGATKLPFKGSHDIMPIGATSSAAPIATSLVALMLSVRPTLDAKTVVKLIQQGCDDASGKGFNIHTGYGRVNFGKTLKLALTHK